MRKVFVNLFLSLILGSLSFDIQARTSILKFSANSSSEQTCNVEIINEYGNYVSSGFQPLKIEIANNTSLDVRWNLTATAYGRDSKNRKEDYLSSEFRFSIPPSAKRVYDFYVPIFPRIDDARYTNNRVRFDINSHQLHNAIKTVSNYHKPRESFPVILATEDFMAKFDADVNKAFRDKITKKSYTPDNRVRLIFDLPRAKFPTDWRAFSGVDFVLLGLDEWNNALPSQSLSALLDWIHMGGNLMIFGEQKSAGAIKRLEKLSSVKLNKNSFMYHNFFKSCDFYKIGLGNFVYFAKSTKAKFSASSEVKDKGAKISAVDFVNAMYGGDLKKMTKRELAKELSEISDKTVSAGLISPNNKDSSIWVIVGLFFLYCCLIGPINFFVFASKNKRHRLFITTPIIAGVASILFFVIILLWDGIGAKGFRRSLILLNNEPNTPSAYLFQAQSVKSALLTNNKFSLPIRNDTYTLPIFSKNIRSVNINKSRRSRWQELSHAIVHGGSERKFSGNWFRNRTLQAMYMENKISTRARIENHGSEAGKPKLISALDFSIENLYYVDGDGVLWKCQDLVKPGSQIDLIRMPKSYDFYKRAFLKERQEMLFSDARLQNFVKNFSKFKNTFIALSQDENAEKLFVNTLKDIKWQSQKSIIIGKTHALN